MFYRDYLKLKNYSIKLHSFSTFYIFLLGHLFSNYVKEYGDTFLDLSITLILPVVISIFKQRIFSFKLGLVFIYFLFWFS